ncbi:tetratricopeptide repeat-containing sulfotransferase family protein [Sagittula salina]|uniref:Sulfotransferase n=1 Tax=Sagittula salina TaxID=2820268 RepID=A0A940S0D8_9RHOB|nr:sulfotransferase [Sagittula salina]MBP0481922.1 sulfotransferase [Sagittula salina]
MAEAESRQDETTLDALEARRAADDLDGLRGGIGTLPPGDRFDPRAFALRHALLPLALPGLDPRPPAAEVRRLEAALNAGQPEVALSMARALGTRLPRAALPWRAQALALAQLGRLSEARDAYTEALTRAPDHMALYAELARVLYDMGALDELAAPAGAAAEARPDDPQAIRLAAVAAHVRGDRDTARRLFARLVKLQPTNGAAHRALSELTHYSDRKDPHIARMQRLAKSGSKGERLTPFEELELHFALGKAMADLRRPQEAFRHYAQGNALKKSSYGLSVDRYQTEAARLRERLALPEPGTKIDAACDTPVPILVVGLPRSGTTLAETLLSAHPQVGSAGECTYLRAHLLSAVMTGTPAPQDFAALRDGYRRALAQASGAPFVIDKMPLNFTLLPLVQALLPEARVVALQRDPMALGWSLFRQCFPKGGNGFAYDLNDIAEAQALFAEVLALQEAEGLPLHRLSYAALTEDPEATLRAALDFIGLPWDEACRLPAPRKGVVATASSMQVRGGIYRGADEDWRAYADHLAPLKERLGALGLL